MISKGGSTVEASASVSLRFTVFIEIEKTWFSWKVIDSFVGLELKGGIDFTVDLRIRARLR